MKGIKGFTLVELVIVIIIVGILSIVSVAIYRTYVKRAYATEGKALLGAIRTAENIYYAANGRFVSEGSPNNRVSKGEIIDVDCSSNKYFTSFYVDAEQNTESSGMQYYAQTDGTGDATGLAMGISVLSNGEVSYNDWWNDAD